MALLTGEVIVLHCHHVKIGRSHTIPRWFFNHSDAVNIVLTHLISHNMLPRAAVAALLFASSIVAQSSDSTELGTGSAITLTGSNSASASVTFDGTNYVAVTTGITYASNGNTITFTSTGTLYSRPTGLSSVIANETGSSTTGNSTSTSATQTILVGGTASSTSGNSTGTASSTTSSVQPTNTVPCNGYPSFCGRSYSNITHVAAHNS